MNLMSKGFDHVLMVDNDSTQTLPDHFDIFVEMGFVSLYKMSGQGIQRKAYAEMLCVARKMKFEWVMMVDLDEFPHTNENNIKHTISKIPENIHAIYCPSFNFLLQNKVQPTSVVNSLTKVHKSSRTWKTISRVKYVLSLNVHNVTLLPWHNYVSSYNLDMNISRNNINPQSLSNSHVKESLIKINHYKYQSLQFHNEIVANRGRVSSRNKKYARKIGLDQDDYDVELGLKNKILDTYPSLYANITKENPEFESCYPRRNIINAIKDIIII